MVRSVESIIILASLAAPFLFLSLRKISSSVGLRNSSRSSAVLAKVSAPSVTISAPSSLEVGGTSSLVSQISASISLPVSRAMIAAVLPPETATFPDDFRNASASLLSSSDLSGGPVKIVSPSFFLTAKVRTVASSPGLRS